jgi:hypothetical protein
MAHVHPFSIAGRWRCSFLPEARLISMSARNPLGKSKDLEAMEAMALIEIDGVPLKKNGWIFHGELLNKMVDIQIYPVYPTTTIFYSTLRLIKTLRGSVL